MGNILPFLLFLLLSIPFPPPLPASNGPIPSFIVKVWQCIREEEFPVGVGGKRRERRGKGRSMAVRLLFIPKKPEEQ